MTDQPRLLRMSGTGRGQFIALGVGGLAALALPAGAVRAAGAPGEGFVYVGSYTKDPPGGGSNNPVGISVFKFDPSNGALSPVQQPSRAVTGSAAGS